MKNTLLNSAMEDKLHKKSILKKTARVSCALLFSKLLGVVREFMQVSYLGVGSLSDAFNTAMKIPTFLRKLFAEGALSAAFVPTIIKVTREDSQDQASRLMVLTYIIFGAFICVLCSIVSLFPEPFIILCAKGFVDKPEAMAAATSMLRVLIYFVFFVFTSSLLASALQAKMHFTVPAWGPAILNVFYISGLIVGLYWNLSVAVFAYFLLLGGLIQALLYACVYFKLHFKILWPTTTTVDYFKEVLYKFIPALISVSIVEINLIIDNQFASTLPPGSVTLLSISSKFMTLMLGAFTVAFSTIILSHFSRVAVYAPKRLSYYLLESVKFIFWVIVPIAFLLGFFSYDIFFTLFYRLAEYFGKAQAFTHDQVVEAASLLITFLPGLFFFSINKVLLTLYYVLHETRYTMYITIIGAVLNSVLNLLFMPIYGIVGIALATVITGIMQSVLLLLVLWLKLGFTLYLVRFGRFVLRYSVQLLLFISFFYALYTLLSTLIINLIPGVSDFLLHHIGLWLWVGPICLLSIGFLYYLRNTGGLNIYFIK